MSTTTSRAEDILVVDMSTVRFQWNPDHTACAALTCRGETLAIVPVDDPTVDARELAWKLLDAALDQGRLLRADPDDPTRRSRYAVALYNPFSGEVSVGAVPETVTFTDHEPLALPAEGAPAAVVTGGRAPHLRMGDGRVLTPRELTFAALTRLQVAHQAA